MAQKTLQPDRPCHMSSSNPLLIPVVSTENNNLQAIHNHNPPPSNSGQLHYHNKPRFTPDILVHSPTPCLAQTFKQHLQSGAWSDQVDLNKTGPTGLKASQTHTSSSATALKSLATNASSPSMHQQDEQDCDAVDPTPSQTALQSMSPRITTDSGLNQPRTGEVNEQENAMEQQASEAKNEDMRGTTAGISQQTPDTALGAQGIPSSNLDMGRHPVQFYVGEECTGTEQKVRNCLLLKLNRTLQVKMHLITLIKFSQNVIKFLL